MKKFYPFILFLIIVLKAKSQDCSSLQLSYTANESRCVATGSIQVTALGGSGDYNYKATGPVSTPFTSSALITGLTAGYYTIVVEDLTLGCTKSLDSVFIPGTYSDPRFELTKTDAGCAGDDGSISVVNQQFGRAPFNYTIIAPSPSAIGSTNTTGEFWSLTPGEYSIQLMDSCGGIQVRKITIENYDWWFDSTAVQNIDCDNASIFIKLADNRGQNNISDTAFNNFSYGIVLSPGDTTWKSTYSFSILLSKKRSLTLVARDGCGLIHTKEWTVPANIRPSIGDVELSYFTCTNFKASLTSAKNFSNPEYCLYDDADILIDCNQTGIFTDLSYGSYCIKVKDICYDTLITRCFTSLAPVPSVGPDVSISNKNCSSFSAAITGQTNLINPDYCLLNSNNDTLQCNTTGVFDDLLYGSYCIQVKNGCSDTVITRCFTVTKPIPAIASYTISANDCSSFNVTANGENLFSPLFCLYDSVGTVVGCDSSGTFSNLPHGNYCMRAISCGDTTIAICFNGTKPIPSVANDVQITNRICTGFTATITGQINITSPKYCLLNSADSILSCNTTGVFANIPYGSYCVAVHDSCTDSTIKRCFTELQPIRTVNSTVQESNRTCTTLTAKITGSNFINPQYCVYNDKNVQIACNTNGIFNNLPYGSYCFTVKDACIDTTIKICKSFTTLKGITVTSSKSCTIGSGVVSIQFLNTNSPYRIKIYRPDGIIKYDTTTTANPFKIQLPYLAEDAEYKIVGIDACNQKDTALISPNATLVTKSVTVKSKCPTARFQFGAGDLSVKCSSNYYTVQPKIIRKGASNFNKNHSTVTNGVYTFSDLEPSTYVIEYKMQSCGSRLYDTVGIGSYKFPKQGNSAIYQCNNGDLSLSGDVQDGVGPYNYQIFGSVPASPSINTVFQDSAVFSINNGTQYSLIRMRAIDACGNGTLNDVSVLPLQNISVKASQLCFFEEVSLTVDTIANASYTWYKKTSVTDSSLVGSGLSYNLPFFLPEESGTYVCKMDVNNGCLTRVSSFLLDGSCHHVLPTKLELKGKENKGIHQLSWPAVDDKEIVSYTIERKTAGDYKRIGSVAASNASSANYLFNDQNPEAGTNWYRLKANFTDGQFSYSNIVSIKSHFNSTVFPNPAKDELYISLNTVTPAHFKIEMMDLSGRVIYTNDINTSSTKTIGMKREERMQKGIYLIRISNTSANSVEVHKIFLE